MLEEDEVALLTEMTTALHEESGVDKLIILSNLHALYYPDTCLSTKDVSIICHIRRDKIRHIEHQALRKIKHPRRIHSFSEYVDISEHKDFCSMSEQP